MRSKPMQSREDVMAAMELVAEKDSSYAAGSVFILSAILDVLFDLREQNERLIDCINLLSAKTYEIAVDVDGIVQIERSKRDSEKLDELAARDYPSGKL